MRDTAGQLADRLHLLRLTQSRLGALALGDLRQQPLVRGFELARSFSHQALQALGGPLPVEQMAPYLILAAPGAQRGLNGADQRDRMDRPLQKRDVLQQAQQAKPFSVDRFRGSLAREHHEGEVRPWRLMLDPMDKLLTDFAAETLLRDEGGTGALFQSPEQIPSVGTDDGTDTSLAQKQLGGMCIAPDRGEHENLFAPRIRHRGHSRCRA